jgi:hypothetical protein
MAGALLCRPIFFGREWRLLLAPAENPDEKWAKASRRRRKGANQMRLSNPLLLASLGVLLAVASCTLITDVDRSKIPDGQAGAPPDNGGGTGATTSMGGEPNTPMAGSGGSLGGEPNTGGTGGVPAAEGGSGGVPASEGGTGGAPEGGTPGVDGGMGGGGAGG